MIVTLHHKVQMSSQKQIKKSYDMLYGFIWLLATCGKLSPTNSLSVINKEHIERLARIVHKQYERYKDKLDGKEVTDWKTAE